MHLPCDSATWDICTDREVCVCCIVLYLYIYIALLAVHTNQKRFQHERPREMRAVWRERREALGSPVNKMNHVEGKSWFQSEGPNDCKGSYLSHISKRKRMRANSSVDTPVIHTAETVCLLGYCGSWNRHWF